MSHCIEYNGRRDTVDVYTGFYVFREGDSVAGNGLRATPKIGKLVMLVFLILCAISSVAVDNRAKLSEHDLFDVIGRILCNNVIS